MQKDEIVPFGRLPAIPVPARGETLPSAMRNIGRQQQCSQPSRYAGEPMDRRCWKHSRQNTGRPCVGRKGTVVSFPHCEQFVRVSVLVYECPRDGPCDATPTTPTRLPLQFLQRLGSFLNCLSWKNNCSPAVNTKSVPQSMHFKTLSWYSIEEALPARPCSARETRIGKDPVHNVGRGFTSPSC